MTPTTFLPHPVRVEAVQVTVTNLAEVAKWCKGSVYNALHPDNPTVIEFTSHEQEKWARVGDWIVSHPTLGFSVESDSDFKLLYYTY